MSEERREDNVSDNLSESSSVVDGRTKNKGWLRYIMQAAPLYEANIVTKNLHGSVFENFRKTLIGKNEYICTLLLLSKEGVRGQQISCRLWGTQGAGMTPFLIPKQDQS